jgi:hypothetical protein
MGWDGRSGGGGDASAGTPEVKFHLSPFWTGRWQARSRIFLSPTLRRSIR